MTNTMDIVAYEAVELVSVYGGFKGLFLKRTRARLNFGSNIGRHIVAGPAKLILAEAPPTANGPQVGAVTVLITPEVFPPDRTITIGPGIGGAAITLECSTDLVNWTAATNGVYTNPASSEIFQDQGRSDSVKLGTAESILRFSPSTACSWHHEVGLREWTARGAG